MRRTSLRLLLVLTGLGVAACDWPTYESPYAGMPPLKERVVAVAVAPAAAAPAAVAAANLTPEQAQAAQVFATRCAVCHGPNGDANIPVAKGLVPPPRNFRDAVWQKATTDAAIEDVIARGGAALGKSPVMPPNPDLAAKPEMLRALRAHVRSFNL